MPTLVSLVHKMNLRIAVSADLGGPILVPLSRIGIHVFCQFLHGLYRDAFLELFARWKLTVTHNHFSIGHTGRLLAVVGLCKTLPSV